MKKTEFCATGSMSPHTMRSAYLAYKYDFFVFACLTKHQIIITIASYIILCSADVLYRLYEVRKTCPLHTSQQEAQWIKVAAVFSLQL